MASGNFSKGSKEWQMFTDFWVIAKKYWIPEESDEYWECLVHDVSDFSNKYPDVPLAHLVGMALLDNMEHISRGRTTREAVRKHQDEMREEEQKRMHERIKRTICEN